MLGPDDYPRQPYWWTLNQAGHAAIVGIGLAGLLIWMPPVAAAIIATTAYFLVWEWGYQIVTTGSKLYRDAIADTLNVGFGAGMAAAVGPDPVFWTIWGGWLVVLAIGAGLRS
jgi:hypothetical protein